MLKLKKLRFSGIGRFVEEQIIYFDRLGNIVQVDGLNNNTEGSSGAGKSTVFQVLEFLLGINDLPNSVLKSRLTENGMFAEGTFDFDDHALVITRGKKLKIDLDGEITEGSSKITEEKLDSILAIPRDLFRKMLHKRQKEGGFFLKMTPSEINEFLMNCLGLSHFKQKIKIVEDKAKELAECRTTLNANIGAVKAAIQATQEGILSMGLPPVKEIHQSVILELKQKMDKSASDYAVVLNAYKIESDTLELSRPQIAVIPYDRAGIEQLYSKSNEIKAQIDSLKQAERARYMEVSKSLFEAKATRAKLQTQLDRGALAKTEALRVAAEIKKIRESLCPTCEQSWANDQAKAKEEELLGKVRVLKEAIGLMDVTNAAIKGIDVSIAQFEIDAKPQPNIVITELEATLLSLSPLLDQERQKEQDYMMVQNDKNKEIWSKFGSMQVGLKQRQAIDTDRARGQADVDRRAFDAAVAKLKAYEESRIRYDNSLNSLKNQETTYSAKLESLIKDFINVDKDLEIAEEIKRGLKSYLSCSFDDALETISENATKLIRAIPNMANATIQLEGIKETKEGKIKEEVNAVIHMDGEENVDIRSLCGGERTSTDLSIDLSVIDLIESRSNKGIDLFILDEPFDGLDTVCIEMALEVLKNSNLNKRLFIVDHNPEVKEMVESKLLVTRTGAFSKITQS